MFAPPCKACTLKATTDFVELSVKEGVLSVEHSKFKKKLLLKVLYGYMRYFSKSTFEFHQKKLKNL